MQVSNLHDFFSNINVLSCTGEKGGEKLSMANIQKAVDEDPKFHNISKEYELQLWEDLATYRTTLRSGMHLTCKGSARDVINTPISCSMSTSSVSGISCMRRSYGYVLPMQVSTQWFLSNPIILM